MNDNGKIWLATGENRVYLEPSMANRHGLIAGATGTGKTVTLKVIAESFSDLGVPVFMADIKGDLTGMCKEGCENKHIRRSIDTMGIENFTYCSYPVRFFDVYAQNGHPVRTTVSEMGPELLGRLLGLNDTQSGVLRIVFRIADDKGLLLLDLKDLRSMVQHVGDNANEYKLTYGNVTSQSIGAIQRALLTLEDEGGDIFFGEPALNLADWFDWDENGRGVMNILECSELFQHPLLYATFLLWMLSELYEMLPEAGDLDKPKIAFFFDEAHLLFNDAPKALIEKVEQVVRLIRSKGVSVWFISQSPSDIPETVLAQIGSRVQHALRAYTPNEQKAIHYAARSFRVNPNFDTERVLQELAVGEALVSVLDEKGVPTIVERAGILPPRSSMNAVEPAELQAVINSSPLGVKYNQTVDRESAYEMLTAQHQAQQEAYEQEQAQLEEERAELEKAKQETELDKQRAKLEKEKEKLRLEREKLSQKAKSKSTYSSTRRKTSPMQKTINSAANTIGRELGKQLIRGIFGTLK
ncbi:MAG: DUF853 family protein [Ruminococcaceae bacterium]|nr:DUF853 family protein [Oscillospiraceae bacterium]